MQSILYERIKPTKGIHKIFRDVAKAISAKIKDRQRIDVAFIHHHVNPRGSLNGGNRKRQLLCKTAEETHRSNSEKFTELK